MASRPDSAVRPLLYSRKRGIIVQSHLPPMWFRSISSNGSSLLIDHFHAMRD